MALAVVCYFDAVEVVVGGVTGLSIICKNLFQIPMWVVNFSVNVPLFLFAYRVLNRETFWRTLFATVMLTIFLAVVPQMQILTGDLLVDIIIGGVLMGTGLGLILLSYASSGGSDLAATLINRKIRYLSIPRIMAVIDGIVLLLGAEIFGLTRGIYSLIGIYIITKLSDLIIEGPNHAKLLYIISQQHEQLVEYIMEELERGASYIEITGAFTNHKQRMIMCVTSSKEMVKIKQKIYQMDNNAICFVGDIREAFGEGFTKLVG